MDNVVKSTEMLSPDNCFAKQRTFFEVTVPQQVQRREGGGALTERFSFTARMVLL